MFERLSCLKSSLWQPTEATLLRAIELPLNHCINVYTSEVEMTFEKLPGTYPDFSKHYS